MVVGGREDLAPGTELNCLLFKVVHPPPPKSGRIGRDTSGLTFFYRGSTLEDNI